MASTSGLCSPSSTFKPVKFPPKTTPSSLIGKESIAFPNRSKFSKRCCASAHSLAQDISTSLSKVNYSFPKKKKRLDKDPRELWQRYVDWLYQHKELGLYVDEIVKENIDDRFFFGSNPSTSP